MESKGKYYLTTAIAYTSAKPHIGNNYEIVLADSIARFKRKEGYDVFFQTGTDEHGQKIELKAEAAGITPKEHVDKIAGVIRGLCDLLNISYDKFIRTTDEDHEKQVQKIFKRLYDQGDIYKGAYEGMYCTPCESFWTESQLVDGKCPDCGGVVKPAKEEAYFFRMSKYADRLIKHINEHPEFIQPVSRKNEMMNNFLLPGLQDLCVSRTSFTWGIPVTFDPKHVIYVWLDALTNYITGIGYDADGNSTEQYKKLWPADLVIPSWENIKPEDTDKMVLHIDPGTAFGTGMHETTQLCIRQLRKFITPETELLDVGTGSGILAILSLMFGAKHAVGTDLDICAVEAVAQNCEVNGIDPAQFDMMIGNIITDKEVQDKVGYECYDIVVANILADVLVPLTPVIVHQLKKGGIYITSGIIDDKEQTVVEAVKAAGLEVLEVTYQGEWVSVTARKN